MCARNISSGHSFEQVCKPHGHPPNTAAEFETTLKFCQIDPAPFRRALQPHDVKQSTVIKFLARSSNIGCTKSFDSKNRPVRITDPKALPIRFNMSYHFGQLFAARVDVYFDRRQVQEPLR